MLQLIEKLRQARITAGYNITEAAKKIGVPRSTYQYWEQKGPPIDELPGIAEAFNLPVNHFFVNATSSPASEMVVLNGQPDHQKEDKYTKLLEDTVAFLKEQVRADLSKAQESLTGIAGDIVFARATQRAILEFQLMKESKGDQKKVEFAKEQINKLIALQFENELEGTDIVSGRKHRS